MSEDLVCDTHLCLTLPPDPKTTVKILNHCLKQMKWIRANNLKLKPGTMNVPMVDSKSV